MFEVNNIWRENSEFHFELVKLEFPEASLLKMIISNRIQRPED